VFAALAGYRREFSSFHIKNLAPEAAGSVDLAGFAVHVFTMNTLVIIW
jgi:hypothetical protein